MRRAFDPAPPGHRARLVWDAVCRLDRSGALDAFKEPIKARQGCVGRDATDPRLLAALWLYACVRGAGSARARRGLGAGSGAGSARAATSGTVNADLKTYRGLARLTVRGLDKVTCVAPWPALAYDVMHFAAALAG